MEFLFDASGRLADSARRLLASLPDYDPGQVEQLSRRLRAQGHDPGFVAAVLTQSRLRARSQGRFVLATQEGLQQATRAEVAELHAERYVRAGVRQVTDLTAGLGADSIAFAQAGLRVRAVERDPFTANVAAENLSDFPNARVVVGDALDLDLADAESLFADPARRSGRGRVFDPANYSPGLDKVLALREQVPELGVKVAPGVSYDWLPADVHAQWVEVEGVLVEAGLWFGGLAPSPGRSALVINAGKVSSVEATVDPRSPARVVPARPLGDYIYQPRGAVIRAGALHVVARDLDAGTVSDRIAYLTGDKLVHTVFAEPFRVIDTVPFKEVRGYLRERSVGAVEILKRGTDIVPDRFRKSLRLRGSGHATVILTRLEGKHQAVVVERVDPGSVQ